MAGRSPVVEKLYALKAAPVLRRGELLAHHTATLSGVVASPVAGHSLPRLTRYKQRAGPFLLLADSVRTASRVVRWFSPAVRRQIRRSWPGPVTLVLPAKPGLPDVCYQRGRVAVRVDGSAQVRQLAAACGGLLLSSSLNRRGGKTLNPDLRTRMRLQRHLSGIVSGRPGSGKASTILRLWRNDFTVIRP